MLYQMNTLKRYFKLQILPTVLNKTSFCWSQMIDYLFFSTSVGIFQRANWSFSYLFSDTLLVTKGRTINVNLRAANKLYFLTVERQLLKSLYRKVFRKVEMGFSWTSPIKICNINDRSLIPSALVLRNSLR